MNNLRIDLTNCFGIKSLKHEFDFISGSRRAFAIYAPNGVMKTSFAKTFENLAEAKDERFHRPTTCVVLADGKPLPQESIYVLRSEKDISGTETTVTNILVNPQFKAKYDELMIDIEKRKAKLINALQKVAGVRKGEVEKTILSDCNAKTLPDCVQQLLSSPPVDGGRFRYSLIFDPKAMSIWKDQGFISNAKEFTARYQELFTIPGTIYQRGVFNPTKADTAFKSLRDQDYFKAGHKVHLKGDDASIDQAELEQRLQEVNARIDSDESLKQIRSNMAKNAEAKEFSDLLESLTPGDLETLLEWLKPTNEKRLRIALWAYYVQSSLEARDYVDACTQNQAELARIEQDATQLNQDWENLLTRFNKRFIDMPFELSIANPTDVVAKEQPAKLKFTFVDGSDLMECRPDEKDKMKTLSVGEERALKLLYFLFEVERRRKSNQETLFIIDDIADSFDYKNKHAIILYLRDLCEESQFHQIILTHNFDFFRAISQSFVHRDRCLMANTKGQGIALEKAEGINNVFVNLWKNNVSTDRAVLYATVPFVRNLIEYTRGESDPDYLKLTSLLHWKPDTVAIPIGGYFEIYNRMFNTTHPATETELMVDLLFKQADSISGCNTQRGLDLESKVILSIAIRMKAEQFMINKLQTSNPNYALPAKNQFGELLKDLKKQDSGLPELKILDEISITVSSNIHLNSFMYEPILDLSIDHLVNLYQRVKQHQP